MERLRLKMREGLEKQSKFITVSEFYLLKNPKKKKTNEEFIKKKYKNKKLMQMNEKRNTKNVNMN